MIFRNRAYEKLLETENARLRQENAELFKALMEAHGHHVDAPKLYVQGEIGQKLSVRSTPPGMSKDTMRKAGKVPWAVRQKWIEDKVASMNPVEVMRKLHGKSTLPQA